jgi:putative oxygen-independent coproporphyrinogen III oxidase
MIAKSVLPRGLSLYVHWPYCKSICPYCDFNRYKRESINHELMSQCYNRILDQFFTHNQHLLYPYTHIESVFFGGGTPSLADAKVFHRIIERVQKLNQSLPQPNEHIEVTMEANPNSIEISKLSEFKDAGINRLSIGVQSFNALDLQFLGRQHSVEEAKRAIDTAQSLFGEKVSIDLMFGTPQHANNEQIWHQVLKEAFHLGLSHISLYQLTIEKNTQFYRKAQNGEFILPEEDCSERLYQNAIMQSAENGLEHYEVSNFAAPGNQCKHNLQYWRSMDYLGIGPGAHSRITDSNNQRYSMVQIMKPEDWMAEVINGEVSNKDALSLLGSIKVQSLTMEQRIEECVMMGLRLVNEGLLERELSFQTDKGSIRFEDIFNRNILKQLIRHDFITLDPIEKSSDNRRLKATYKGIKVLDELLASLLL